MANGVCVARTNTSFAQGLQEEEEREREELNACDTYELNEWQRQNEKAIARAR